MSALRALVSMTHTIILLGVMLEMQTFLQTTEWLLVNKKMMLMVGLEENQ